VAIRQCQGNVAASMQSCMYLRILAACNETAILSFKVV